MIGANTRLPEFIRYGAASAAALTVDASTLWVLTGPAAAPTLVAATLSFILGCAVAYMLSIRFVFAYRRMCGHMAEFPFFVLTGIAGLGVNLLVIEAAMEIFHQPLPIAKATAAACTFATNYLLRRRLLFSLPARHGGPRPAGAAQ